MTEPNSLPPHPPTAADAPSGWLQVARAAWVVAAVVLIYLHVRGLLSLFQTPINLCFQVSSCTFEQANAYLQGFGLNPALIATFSVLLDSVIVPLAYLGVAVVIMWRRGNNPMAVAIATLLLLFSLYMYSNMVATALGPLPWIDTLDRPVLVVFNWALAYALHTFPNGRFVPRWDRLVMLAEGLVLVALGLTVGLVNPLAAANLAVVGTLGVGLQIYRYRRVATPTEHQQLKWGLLGLLAFAVNGLIWQTLVAPLRDRGVEGLGADLLYLPFSTGLVLILPITLAIAVLRYRLWDIDVLIRRTLIYSTLTAVLTATYFGLVVLLQAAAGQITGQANSALVTVLSTLAIAALFAPLRRRVQNFVDRRFYRRKYDTAQTLAAFAAQARDEMNLEQLSGELRGAVEAAMQPAHVDLWLR